MKRQTLLSIILILTTIVSANAQFWNKTIRGNGKVSTISRSTSVYDAISCAGSMDFILIKGKEGKIKIEGEENLLEHIVTEVKDKKLKIKVENNVNLKTSRNKQIKITIPFKEVNQVSLAGSGDLWSEDEIFADKLKVSLAGSGDVNIQVRSDFLKSSLAGSGDIRLTGETDELDVNIAGSGDFHGFELEADRTDVSIAGSGNADVVANGKLKVRITGSGDVRYKGSPENEDTKVVGSGNVSSK